MTQEDIRTSDNASIVLSASELIFNKGLEDDSLSVKADGNIKLNALNGSITFNSSLEGNNHLSILAQDNISLLDGNTLTTIDGTIDILASNGFINMHENSIIKSTNSNMKIEAKGDLSIGKIETSANISLLAGNIYDSSSIQDEQIDIIASKLRVETTNESGAFAKADNHLETKIDTISVKNDKGGVFISQTGSLLIGNIMQNDTLVNRVLDTALVQTSSDNSLSGIETNSSLILDSKDGSIETILGSDISSEDNTLIKTSNGTISFNSSLSSVGSISIISSMGLDLSSSSSIETTGFNSTVDILNNSSYDFNMEDGSFINTNNSNIRVEANNINISSLNANEGKISLLASGNITDSGDSLSDIISKDLRVSSLNGGFGNNGTLINALETKVENIALNVGNNGVYIQEEDSLNITKLESINVNIIDSQAQVSLREDLSLSNIQSKQNVQIDANGVITLKKALDENIGIEASLDITLNSLANDIVVENEINSQNGNILIDAFDSISQDSTIKTLGENKNINLIAQGGDIEMLADSLLSNENVNSGYISLKAATSITTEDILSSSNVILEANSSFVKDIDENSLIKANSLKITAGTKVGSFNNFMNTDIASLEVESLSNKLYLEEKDNVTITADKLQGSIKADELTLNVVNIGDEDEYLETKIDVLNSNTENEIFLQEEDNLTINTDTLIGSIKASEVSINANNIGESDNFLKTQIDLLNLYDINEEVFIEESDSIEINTNKLLGSIKAQDLIIKGSNIGEVNNFLETQVNTLDIDSSNNAFIKEFDSIIIKDSKANNIFALESLSKDIYLDRIEAGTVSLKVSDEGRVLDNNNEALNIQAQHLNMLGRGAYSQGDILNAQSLNEAIETSFSTVFMAGHNNAKVTNYLIDDVNYALLVEKDTYSLQYVNNKDFTILNEEHNSNLANDMISISMWQIDKKLNYQLLNLSSNVNNSYYEYKSKELSSLNVLKSFQVKNTFNFNQEQMISTNLEERSFSNELAIISLQSANNIFDYEEDYEFWVEDLAL